MKLSPSQIFRLHAHQTCGQFHGYTCCDHQMMEATEDGLRCPKCGRVQDIDPDGLPAIRLDGPFYRVPDELLKGFTGSHVPMPTGFYRYNGGVECDMLRGPCSCGAWH